MKTKIFFILSLILTFILKVEHIYATTYFSEEFNKDNLDNWNLVPINENWKIVDQKLVGDVVAGQSSFIIAKSFENLSNYSIRVDADNQSGVDQNIVFRVSNDQKKYYLLDLRFNDPYWSQDGGEIVLWKYDSDYKRLSTFNDLNQIKLTQNEVHKIKIELNNNNIKIYFDSVPIIDINDEDSPILTGSFGFYNWGGNYYQRSTKNIFDNLIVGDFNYDEPEIKKPKIIVIPGLGASWSTNAIVYNQNVNADQWKMTPFVKNYNGLIKALENNGLVKDQDFYVWNYDWRRPVSEIENKLNSFIDEKIKSDEKIILIGHSLGGVVSRVWAEDHKDDSRLEKVIDLAAPNLGSIDTYEIWNGGQISDLSKISSIAFKILLKIQSVGAKSDMEAARNYAPVVKDLLPTFSYLTKNGKTLANSSLETNNTYLQGKNNDGQSSGIDLGLYVGNGFQTIDSIELKNNNIFDKALGIWPDGRINKFLYSTSGDGTVLSKSASYGKSDFITIDSDHGEIVDKTVNQIMTDIGLSQINVISEAQNLKDNLVIFVGSPVNYSVKCDDQSPVNDVDGFVVMKNNNYKSCTVNLVGTGDGLIHVVSGNTNDTDWSYWEKGIKNGEIDIIKINPTNGQIISDKDNISFLKSVIKEDITSLLITNKNNKYLKESLKNVDKNQPKTLVINMFGFRNGSNERNISERIIDNSTKWLSLVTKCSKNEANKGYKIIDGYQDLIESLITLKSKKNSKINENAAVSYLKMDELLKASKTDLNNKKYENVCVNNFAALSYGSEVLIKAYNKNDFKMWLLQDSDL